MYKNVKIYILTNTLLKGGAEKQSVLLAKNLKDEYSTTIIVYYGEKYHKRLIDEVNKNKLNIIFLKGNHPKKIIYLYNLFKQNKDSIIFSYLLTTNFLNAIIGSLAGVKFKIGGIRSSIIPYFKLKLQKILHNHFLTATISNNYSGQKNLIKKGFNRNKCFCIHNGIEIKEAIINRDHRTNIEILTVGRFVPAKDYYTALKAIFLLKKMLANSKHYITYTIIGFGSEENKIKSWIEYFNLKDTVSLIINPNNLNNYYQKADIYFSTSLYEGLSNSIIEAMEFSLPIVATNVGDNEYLIIEGQSGFLLPIKDAEGMSSKLKLLVDNPKQRVEFGHNAYRHLKNNFLEEIFKQKYINFINNLFDEC